MLTASCCMARRVISRITDSVNRSALADSVRCAAAATRLEPVVDASSRARQARWRAQRVSPVAARCVSLAAAGCAATVFTETFFERRVCCRSAEGDGPYT